MLTARSYHAHSIVDGRLYVTGGMIRPLNSIDEVLTSMEVYDPRLDSWQRGTPMSEPLLLPRAASQNHLLYVCGLREGYLPENQSSSSRVSWLAVVRKGSSILLKQSMGLCGCWF